MVERQKIVGEDGGGSTEGLGRREGSATPQSPHAPLQSPLATFLLSTIWEPGPGVGCYHWVLFKLCYAPKWRKSQAEIPILVYSRLSLGSHYRLVKCGSRPNSVEMCMIELTHASNWCTWWLIRPCSKGDHLYVSSYQAACQSTAQLVKMSSC